MFTKFKKPFPPQNRILCFPRYKHRPIKLPPALITKEILGFDAKDVQDLANQQELMVYHRSVNEIIRQKAPDKQDIHFIDESEPISHATQRMAKEKIGFLVVINPNYEVVGVLGERDFIRVLEKTNDHENSINTVMTARPTFAYEDATIIQCLKLMASGDFRHLPVVDRNNVIVGVISIGDLIKAILNQYKETVEALRSFITERW